MKARRGKSNRLFHELAADFGALRPGFSHTVCCPLCLHEFPLDAIDKLSVEHIVPSRLGGQSRTLTCLGCNNGQGTRLDSHLIGAMKAMDSVEGTEPIATIMPNAKGNVVADMFPAGEFEDSANHAKGDWKSEQSCGSRRPTEPPV